MKGKLLLLIALVVGTCSLGMAGACGVGTLSDYTAAGFSCTIGSLTFSNFSYSSGAFGGATAIPAGGVNVTPQTGAEAGFMFTAPWVASASQGVDSEISYTVTASGVSITDLLLSMAGFGFTDGGDVSVAETAPTPPLSLLVFDNATGMVASDSATFLGVSSLTVTKDIAVVGGGSGTGHLSVVFNEFSTSSVPEPASMLLLGSGLIGLAGFVRRRRTGRSA
jgi:PEP-CTERM motif